MTERRMFMNQASNERIFYMAGPNGETYRVPESRLEAFNEMMKKHEQMQSTKEESRVEDKTDNT